MKMTLAGKTSSHRAKLEAHAEDWLASVTASGGVADLTWRGTLDSFDVDEKVLGDWHLAEPARVEAGRFHGSSRLAILKGARFGVMSRAYMSLLRERRRMISVASLKLVPEFSAATSNALRRCSSRKEGSAVMATAGAADAF